MCFTAQVPPFCYYYFLTFRCVLTGSPLYKPICWTSRRVNPSYHHVCRILCISDEPKGTHGKPLNLLDSIFGRLSSTWTVDQSCSSNRWWSMMRIDDEKQNWCHLVFGCGLSQTCSMQPQTCHLPSSQTFITILWYLPPLYIYIFVSFDKQYHNHKQLGLTLQKKDPGPRRHMCWKGTVWPVLPTE